MINLVYAVYVYIYPVYIWHIPSSRDPYELRFKHALRDNLYWVFSGAFGGRHEKKLLRDLMVDYDNLERPVVNESHALVVTFGITLQQIIDVVSCHSHFSTFTRIHIHFYRFTKWN